MPPDASPPRAAARRLRQASHSLTAGLSDSEPPTDMAALRAYRLECVRARLKALDYAGCLLYDPINIRYATGSRNMAVWTLHNAVRYCFVATEGPVVLFDFHNCEHLSAGLETIDELRPATAWYYFGTGPRLGDNARRWAEEVAELVKAHGGGNRRLAIDNCNPEGAAALVALGVELGKGQEVMEIARSLKSPEELACMEASIAVCEAAMAQMREALEPGMTENRLWAILNHVNAAMGGEWIETRLFMPKILDIDPFDGAKWPPGCVATLARCDGIALHAAPTQEAISPHRRPRSFVRSLRCAPLVVLAPRREARLASGQKPSGQMDQYLGSLVLPRVRAATPGSRSRATG